jgi:hypothetical protein
MARVAGMTRRVSLLLLAAVLGFSAAGCGAGRGKPYTAAGTVPCLRAHGFTKVTTNPAKIGLIAGFAENGGLQATSSDGNVLTIAFTSDSSAVPGTETAFRKAAPPRYKGHMQDVMKSQGNAVLVWTVTPEQQKLTDALACLHS